MSDRLFGEFSVFSSTKDNTYPPERGGLFAVLNNKHGNDSDDIY